MKDNKANSTATTTATTTPKPLGIVDRMRAAKTDKVRKELLEEAQGYQYISPVTMRKLVRLAKAGKVSKKGK